MRSLYRLVVVALFAAACGDNLPAGNDAGFTEPECSDGIDNDGDGQRDFPDDLGCDSPADDSEDSPPKPACSDNRDNDGDGKIDYPNDPGCQLPQADDETDDCPDGPTCPACSNGRDDDNNGFIDFPLDPGCESAADNTEFAANSNACGAGLQIVPLPLNGEASGTFDVAQSLSNILSPCGGGGGSPGVAYGLVLSQPKVIVASTDHAETTADTVLDVRGAMCTSASSHITCSDDIDGGDNTASRVTASLQPGIYYIIVEGHDTSVTGNYKLVVQQFAGEGAMCAMTSDCGPGLVCRVPVNGTDMICTKPVCSDGLDDDGDGKIDFPLDPGCQTPADDTEDDDCPDGPNCPECSDGEDNDGDGQIDYPNDTSCAAASSSSEACDGEIDPIVTITMGTTGATMVGASDDYTATCGGDFGEDKLFALDVPAMSTLTVNTNGSSFDTLISLLNGSCGTPALGCDDDGGPTGGDSLLTVTNIPGGRYYVAVDAYSSGLTLGAFNVNVSGRIAPGASCESPLFAAGAITCATGTTCQGPAGARRCVNECTDGVDNNSDGRMDYPNDPGCDSPNDPTENTVCPGASCPACADGIDNDDDGDIDYPADSSCNSASGTSEACEQSEPVVVVTSGMTMGTTVGATNDIDVPCASSFGSGRDVALQLDVPMMQSLTLNLTTTMDSAHALFGASCGGAALACSDPTNMTVNGVTAGRYYLVVDGWSSSAAGAFTLNTSGIIAPGGSCENALFASGAFTCAAGTTCDGTPGARTCRSECSDGIDNNGDGKIDFPNDPGCTSPADNTEDTVCPGASCPQCANGADDDADTLTDYPTDFGCASAADNSEVFCMIDPDYAGAITTPTMMGTLASPAMDNYEQSCQGNTGNDVVYSLQSPVPALWEFTTEGSTITDTVLAVRDANCGTSLGCDDDNGTGNLSRLLLFLPAGNYAVQVDSYSASNHGPYKLNTKGTVLPGTSCTSPLFASGVLVCGNNTTCTAGTCQ